MKARRRSPSSTSTSDLAVFLLRIDLAVATREREDAQWAQGPFEAAFKAAHRFLATLPPRSLVGKNARLAAYDARMEAGYAWHPHRARLREATRWIKAIEEDLKWYE